MGVRKHFGFLTFATGSPVNVCGSIDLCFSNLSIKLRISKLSTYLYKIIKLIFIISF